MLLLLLRLWSNFYVVVYIFQLVAAAPSLRKNSRPRSMPRHRSLQDLRRPLSTTTEQCVERRRPDRRPLCELIYLSYCCKSLAQRPSLLRVHCLFQFLRASTAAHSLAHAIRDLLILSHGRHFVGKRGRSRLGKPPRRDRAAHEGQRQDHEVWEPEGKLQSSKLSVASPPPRNVASPVAMRHVAPPPPSNSRLTGRYAPRRPYTRSGRTSKASPSSARRTSSW